MSKDAMTVHVENLVKVKANNVTTFLFLCKASDFIVKGNYLGQAQFTLILTSKDSHFWE